MRYLVLVRGKQVADGDIGNSTPAVEVWGKIVELKNEDEISRTEKLCAEKFSKDYEFGIEVEFVPLPAVDNEWEIVGALW